MLRAWIVGHGRMGRRVERAWRERGHRVTARLDAEADWSGARAGRSDAEAGGERTRPDVAFEFTGPGAAPRNVSRLLERGIATVCGTTGWDPAPARSEADRRGVPLLVAPNFSSGVTALRAALEAAARRLTALEGFEPAVAERHHRSKEDAPSGTASALADDLEAAFGARPPVASLRQGDQPGVHHVLIEGPDEEIRLTHRARSLRPFAAGAVAAGETLARERPPGDVRLDDLLAGGRPGDD